MHRDIMDELVAHGIFPDSKQLAEKVVCVNLDVRHFAFANQVTQG